MVKRKAGSDSFYAVLKGRTPGIYASWEACQCQTSGFQDAVFKKIRTKSEAQYFIDNNGALRSDISENLGCLGKPIKLNTDIRAAGRYGNEVVVYTDGAGLGNGTNRARAGIGVFWGKHDLKNLAERLPGSRQTNQRAELTAIIRALEHAPKEIEVLTVVTDSQYSINCLEKWHQGWERSGWKNQANENVENKDLIQLALWLIQSSSFNVSFLFCRGHMGIEGNEEADKLAGMGITYLGAALSGTRCSISSCADTGI
ncbi:Ribonuclease H1 [Neolecta irregularis DAH-3]|uniref:Ribonuclease H n=1 Tax=Neolecta irregularis (strain DAH-3) TaxID=1198029 RepID=A0A1U7LRF6_NEOID|nr:Ribonuclease H1 [Neolecta irregularis DAH-3]|eukprot:OLL25132.1 Ribonuclease H1 [Neolecta irregularis DAH-3]